MNRSKLSEAILAAEQKSPEPVWFHKSVAVICADCENIHNQLDGACPSCTSNYGVAVSKCRIIDTTAFSESAQRRLGGTLRLAQAAFENEQSHYREDGSRVSPLCIGIE